MYNLLTNIAAQRSDVELMIHIGNLEEGLQAILDNRDKRIDAIISRGGTTEVIRRSCSIPVCDITPSAYDILRTIRLAQGMSERFAVIGFPSISEPTRMLCEILQYDCQVITIHSEEECNRSLQQLKDDGIRIIVGDTIAVDCCKKYGMRGLLIVSGIESVESAINSAVEMHRYYAGISRRAMLLSDVLHSSELQVMIYDPEGHPVYDSGEKLPASLHKYLREQVTHVLTQKVIKVSQRFGGEYYTIQGRTLHSDGDEFCVYFVQQSTSAAPDKYRIRYLAPGSDMPNSYPLEYYLGNSLYAQELRGICERYAGSGKPFLLGGPPGTGKDRFAHYIYTRSKWKHSSFVIINAVGLTEKGWDFLLNNEHSPLADVGVTIYFKNLHHLQQEQARQQLLYLRNSHAAKTSRLLFSYNTGSSEVLNNELYYFLTEEMHCMQLRTLPITARPQDIPFLMALYINAFNVQFGTRVIGLTKDAMLTLQNQSWPRNVDQLVQFVQNLVISSESSYISNEAVHRLLNMEETAHPALETYSIDLNRPLDEIIRQVVRTVYLSENMNQTHTARHLGISRSTVWRLLKD